MVSNRKGSAAKAKDGTAWVGIGEGCDRMQQSDNDRTGEAATEGQT